jgi:hypothetical protein
MRHAACQLRSWLIFDVRQSKEMHIVRAFSVILALAGSLRSQEADDREVMRKAKASLQLAGILTMEDIPDAWRSRRMTETIADRTIATYSRGAEKVLEVMWRERLPGLFSCTLYSAGRKVGSIVRATDKVTVLPASDSSESRIITSLRDDGRLEVAIVGKDVPVEDVVIVDGRKTQLLDDLDYAKGRIISDPSTWPVQETLRRTIEGKKRPNKAPEPTPGSVTPRATEGKSK